MRPWLSGITSPCQGLVGVSITPGRTNSKNRVTPGFYYWCWVIEKAFELDYEPEK
jgi:hypothetical protein